MYLLSAKTRNLIAAAVDALPDPDQRQIWHRWADQHQRMLVPNGPVRDDEPPLPSDAAVVALAALKQMEDAKRNLLASLERADEVPEEEVSDLDNDLSYISAVTSLVHQAARG